VTPGSSQADYDYLMMDGLAIRATEEVQAALAYAAKLPQCLSDEGIISMTRRFAILCVVLGCIAGCQTTGFDTLKQAKEKLPFANKTEKVEETEYPPAEKLITIWSDALYTAPGQKPVRGFGARLYFYNNENKAVPVEGQLVVYAYDDSAEGAMRTEPTRKFAFTPEQFTTHYTPSDLGASYSIWIPWDEVGGDRKAISLVPVFTCSDGKVVMGQQSVNVLPGKAPEVVEPPRKGYFTPLSSTAEQEVRPASYEQQARQERNIASNGGQWNQMHTFVPANTARERLRTTSIHVGSTMNQRLIQQRAIGEPATADPQATSQPTRLPQTGGTSDTPQNQPAPMSAEQSADLSAATADSLPTLSATRFSHPRYLAPRAPDGRPVHVRAATPLRPAEPQPGHLAPL
jgi:hypothetical protein